MWRLIAKRIFSPDSEVGLAVHSARSSTIVLRSSLRATGYREQYLQISQVLRHQTGWEWRCQRCCFEASDSDFRSNSNRQRDLISVLYRLVYWPSQTWVETNKKSYHMKKPFSFNSFNPFNPFNPYEKAGHIQPIWKSRPHLTHLKKPFPFNPFEKAVPI